MIGVLPIIRLVELAVWSTAIRDERNPVSILIVARPESGKSDIIELFSKTPNTIVANDLTAWGLANKILPRIVDSKCKILILIPDFLNMLSRNATTVSTLTMALKSLMEEGITTIETKYISVAFTNAVTGGVITSVTPTEFQARRKAWTASGVLSRFIVLSYEHSESTQAEIMELLLTKVAQPREQPRHLTIPKVPEFVEADGRLLRPVKKAVKKYTAKMNMADQSYGYRMQLHFQRLIAAHALSLGRHCVQKSDVDAVLAMLDVYANLDFNKV